MNNYTELPICVECKHCITKDKSIPECALTAIGRDIVTGEYLSPLSCHSARRGNCGHLGSHFEYKCVQPLSDADMQALKDYRDAYASLLAENKELKEKLEDLNERAFEKSLGD